MKRIFLFFFTVTCIIQTNAQSSKNGIITSSDDYFKNSLYTLSCTFCECATETITNKKKSLTQEFQQSSYVVTSINKLITKGLSVEVYPNPVSDLITISVQTENSIQKPVLVKLLDFHGEILLDDKFYSNA